MLKLKLTLIGVLALSLMACASPSAPLVLVQHVSPPAWILADCLIPEGDPATNAELAEDNIALLNALGVCNDDKHALREWDRILREKGASNVN